MSRPLNRPNQLTLMLCTRAGNPFGNDLSLFGNKAVELLFIFIVDVDFLRVAETARPLFSDRIGVALFTTIVASTSILALMKHVRVSFF